MIGDLNSFKNGVEDYTQREWQDHFYGAEGKSKIIYAEQKMGPMEIQNVARSSKSLYYWLKDNGVDLEIISDTNPCYEGIPRTKLEDYV